jgi:hypothetical protein
MAKSDSEFVQKALKRFNEIESDERELRENFKACLSFTYGEQWDPKVKQTRELAGRPALTFNRLPTFVQKVANEARQQKPQIKFNPRLDSDKEVAEIKEGIARQIQYHSEAGIATETAVEYSVAGSYGFIRLLTEYCDDKSFDMDIMVKPVFDPMTVYGVLVPTCFGRKPVDVFVIEDLPKAEFKTLYPDEEEPGDFGGNEEAVGWVGTETYRVAEYWYVEQKPKTIYQLEDGTVVAEKPEDGKVEDERTIQQSTVKFCKMTAKGVIRGSETEWVTDEIPIYAVLAGSKIIDGKPRLFSLVQWQLDAQKMINFGKTRIAEALATSPISPFVVAEGQLENHEAEWQTANSTLRPYLVYKEVSVGGTVIGPPQRQTFEPPIAALSAFVQQEVDDLKATSGIFDQSLGSGTNDQSGIAIKSRQQQSDLTNAHFMDNLERTSQRMGRAIAKAIPKVYSTARVVKIVGPDEVQKMVQINQQHQAPNGQVKMFDLSKGDDDVVVTMGRSFSSKRAESFDMMQSIVQAAPATLSIIGDLLFRNSDIAGSDQLAERFKRMLPEQAQDPADGSEPIPPQAQAQIAQAQQQIQQLHAYAAQVEQQAHQLQQEKQAKVVDNQFKMEIEKMKIEADILKAEITTKAQETQARIELERDMWMQLHGSAHDAATQAQDQAHQQQMAQQQVQGQSQLSAQNAAQTAAQQQAAAEQQQAQAAQAQGAGA